MIEILGQDYNIDRLRTRIQIAMTGLSDPDRPGGVFLLMGHTGSGKTETVHYFAEQYHGEKKYVLRINCGEYQLDHEVARLIGSPPGYLGHRETGAIFNPSKIAAVSTVDCPWSFILFDEIEKASDSLLDILLGIMDKGELFLGTGEKVSFLKTFIFLTGNVGAEKYGRGVWKLEDKIGNFEKEIRGALRGQFRPEFLARLDEILLYNPLGEEALEEICKREIMSFSDRLASLFKKKQQNNPKFSIEDGAIKTLLRKADSKRYGARGIRKAVTDSLIFPVSKRIEEGAKGGGIISLSEDLSFSWEYPRKKKEKALVVP